MDTNIINYGRTVDHDPRSLNYRAPLEDEVKTVEWDMKGPILNQGTSNACVGMAFTHLLNTDLFEDRRIKIKGDAGYLDEQFAYQIYSKATEIDEFVGQMPAEDTGTSALALCKAAKASAYISEYQVAIGFEELKKAIQVQPVMIGMWWTTMMNQPENDGFIKPLGVELGGHETLMVGLNIEDEYITLLSSYGSSYGNAGRVKMKFNYFSELLRNNGDAMTVK